MNHLELMWKLFWIAYYVWVLRIIWNVLLDNRHPVKTLAWILVLLFLPIVGMALYFFLGQNLRKGGYRRDGYDHRVVWQEMRRNSMLPVPVVHHVFAHLQRLFMNQSNSFLYEHNKVDVFEDGRSWIDALLKDINQAHDHIHFESYIFEDDPIGRSVAEALMAKARQGVEVRLVYDDVGCWNVSSSFFRTMWKSGVHVHAFLPLRFPQLNRHANYRNHRKIVVIDGAVGYVGGMNVAARYVNTPTTMRWKDLHLRLEGCAVYGLQRTFLSDWAIVTREILQEERFFPKFDVDTSLTASVQIVRSTPSGKWEDILQGIVSALYNARHYVYIQTPYFLPSDPLLLALQTAALAGVDVRLMMPMKNDSKLTQAASFSYLRATLQAGVKVALFKEGFLHSKMMVVDDLLCTCGSSNMDFRSFEHNFEVNAFIYDKHIAKHLCNVFEEDWRNSEVIDMERWSCRPLRLRWKESVIRLLAPLL